jgi:hypothetical protein
MEACPARHESAVVTVSGSFAFLFQEPLAMAGAMPFSRGFQPQDHQDPGIEMRSATYTESKTHTLRQAEMRAAQLAEDALGVSAGLRLSRS